MALDFLRILNMRNIAAAELRPTASLNLLIGANGSGKTSVLESIYLLSRGKSFRTSQLQQLIQRGTPGLQVFGRVDGRSMGVEYAEAHWRFRVQGSEAQSRLELSELLPATYLGPDTYRFFSGGPREHRHFIDWGVFHVEHRFITDWRRYSRALQQRNALLKSPGRGAEAWNLELAGAGVEIHRWRADYITALRPWVERYAKALLGEGLLNLEYNRGWPEGEEFAEYLSKSLPQDREAGFTRSGPHRADLGLRWDGVSAKEGLSRGQQKLLLHALHLAQTRHFLETTGGSAVLLLDDLNSELDAEHFNRVLGLVVDFAVQVFVTTTSPDLLDHAAFQTAARFHVEQGRIT